MKHEICHRTPSWNDIKLAGCYEHKHSKVKRAQSKPDHLICENIIAKLRSAWA